MEQVLTEKEGILRGRRLRLSLDYRPDKQAYLWAQYQDIPAGKGCEAGFPEEVQLRWQTVKSLSLVYKELPKRTEQDIDEFVKQFEQLARKLDKMDTPKGLKYVYRIFATHDVDIIVEVK